MDIATMANSLEARSPFLSIDSIKFATSLNDNLKINKKTTKYLLRELSKKYLPKETRNYIRRIIIAALLAHDENIISKNNADHLFGSCTNSKLIEVFFNGGRSLSSIACKVGITLKKIKTCNPHLLRSRLPANKKTYHVYLPQELIGNLDTQEDKEISIGRFTYKVKKDDTLDAIAKKYDVSKNTIIWANNLDKKVKTLKKSLVF